MYLLRSWIKSKTVSVVLLILLLCLLVYQESVKFHNNAYSKQPVQGHRVLPKNVCDIDRYQSPEDFENFNNVTGDRYNCTIVPNYLHIVKFKQNTFNFPHTVCLLAALKNQNPDKIFIHTDVSQFQGKYWDVLVATPGFKEKLVINYTPMPREIFGQPLNRYWLPLHGGDLTRLRVLIKFGGIYMDNDSYIVNNLDYFRRFEMALGWKPSSVLGNMLIVAHKNARFLRKWLNSYDGNYKSSKFFYNAGEYPAFHILKQNQHWVHREEKLFGNYGPFKPVYLTPFPEWRQYFSIHTLSNHLYELKGKSPNLKYPVKFSENNINTYPVAYRDMVLSVFPNELITNTTT